MVKIAQQTGLFSRMKQNISEKKISPAEISFFTLQNQTQTTVVVSNFGARVVSIKTPDKYGTVADVVLGFDTAEGYLNADERYFGATVGRFANRIANGRFSIDGKNYRLKTNNGVNHLHGGLRGFHQQLWSMKHQNPEQVTFVHVSADGEEGYPAALVVEVTYTLTEKNELVIDYKAVSDGKTIINLTNHTYFNLAGAGNTSVAGHLLTLNADYYTPVNKNLIPTGEICNVSGSPFDFRLCKEIGLDWDAANDQLAFAGGFDHNFVLNKPRTSAMEWAARVVERNSGRVLQVETTEPGLQFYTGNFLSGKDQGREGISYNRRSAFCLETQHFPDSPNQPYFPSVVLERETPFVSKTIYRFSLA